MRNPSPGLYYTFTVLEKKKKTSLAYRPDKIKAAGGWTVRYSEMEGSWT